ncbi:carbohydrate ABC transporter permease [Paenibacillus beijingensis]|uniref:Sugar ABC transporter permease n=1 Tax=Paenibacillus beijingensis TaxID=1126833 RepID=A0A0D5NQ70_9BACL|nr:carbohydrate ABC transporter permease [Paenibacillus beijingensis]AJY77315.1 sugar ABC transporter permease [Paenibacillus beijingensis]
MTALAKRQRTPATAVVMFITALFAAAFLFPYLYLILSSLKRPEEVISSSPTIVPSVFTLDNFRTMFDVLPIVSYFGNSFMTSICSTAISVFLGSMAAYGLSRLHSRLGNLFIMLTLGVRLVPLISVAVPMYRIINRLGLYDTKLALVLVYTSINIPFVIFMMIGFFDGLPKELDESARVDGCGRFGAFMKIILPISLPGLATTAIFGYMLSWNDFLMALMMTSTSAKTVPVGLSEFLTAYNLDLGPMTAAAVTFSLPVMLFSFAIQRYIVSGITMGAVKE